MNQTTQYSASGGGGMRLLDISLENFQGVGRFRMEPAGRSADIYGDNATGKTTVASAVTWLLFDKPVTGARNYTVKTKGPDGEDIHFIAHSVEGRFSLEGGRVITLKKTLSEDWRERRGSHAKELKGNPVSYFIDGLPVRECDYNTRLAGICDPGRMRLLMLPACFSESLGWEERRALLLEICGDVADIEVIAANPALKELPARLRVPGAESQFYTVEEFKALAGSRMGAVNAELRLTPARIATARELKPKSTPGDTAALAEDETGLRNRRASLEAECRALEKEGDAGGHPELNRRIEAARAGHSQRVQAENEAAATRLAAARREAAGLEQKRQESRELAARLGREAGRLEERRHGLREECDRLSGEAAAEAAAEFTGPGCCPACGRPLQEEQLLRAREAFELEKTARLKRLAAKLEELKTEAQAECPRKAIAARLAGAGQAELEAGEFEKQLAAARGRLAELQAAVKPPEPFKATALYARLREELEAARIAELRAGDAAAVKLKALRKTLAGVAVKLDGFARAQEKARYAQACDAKIAALEAEQKRLSEQFEYYKHGVYLCEEFTRAKVAMLDARINARFKTVRFRLFEQQLNGGLREGCEALIPSGGSLVPWALANSAARVNAGLEIIATLAAHWGVGMPVIVDGAESVTRLETTGAQVLRFIVSGGDGELRVELR